MRWRRRLRRLFQYSSSADLLSPEVFDLDFYRERYRDLRSATPEEAIEHWLLRGLDEGRQAASGFSASEYLAGNADLMQKHGGSAFRWAAGHYLTEGLAEGRAGRCPDEVIRLEGRHSVLRTSRNWGHVVWSLRWKGREVINSHDAGRCLSVAWQEDGLLEARNPTEGGNIEDAVRGRCQGPSASRASLALAQGRSLVTSTRPAYWLPPGHPGSRADAQLSPSVIVKRVCLDCQDDPHVVDWKVEILFRGQEMEATNQIQVMSLFACADLHCLWSYRAEAPAGSRLTRLTPDEGEIWDPCGVIVRSRRGDLSDAVRDESRRSEILPLLTPRHGGVIASDHSGSLAIGLYGDSASSGREHGGLRMGGPNEVAWAVRNLCHLGGEGNRGLPDDPACLYLSSVTRFRPLDGRAYTFTGSVVLGTLREVTGAMRRLFSKFEV